MKTIFKKVLCSRHVQKVTEYDKMQRAFVGDSPQLRAISSFGFEVFIIRYIN